MEFLLFRSEAERDTTISTLQRLVRKTKYEIASAKD
jgi:hypothetical protein